MPKFYKKRAQRGTLPPGTLIPREEGEKVRITVFDYTEKDFHEKEIADVRECFAYRDTHTVTWINIEGMSLEVIREIDDHFGIHPLVAEDIVNVGQRPKVEDHEGYEFIVIKMIYRDARKNDIVAEQISLLLGSNYVISFQETVGDIFDPIRDRIRQAKGRVRKMGADYLAYCLLDAVVDHYFIILETKGEAIEALEEKVISDGDSTLSHEIHRMKRDLVFLHKQIWPLREVLSALQRVESKLIKKETRLYLRDVYDHAIQVIDMIESFRDMLSGLHDLHLSSISNKMNEVMKVLTMIATIFIPMTFLAGIYGMNFENMPELKWHYGYFILLGTMLVTALAMVAYFKKKKWF